MFEIELAALEEYILAALHEPTRFELSHAERLAFEQILDEMEFYDDSTEVWPGAFRRIVSGQHALDFISELPQGFEPTQIIFELASDYCKRHNI